MKKPAIILVLIIIFATPNLLNSGQMRIAIYDFNAKGVSKNTAKSITDWIRTAMAGGDIIIVERTQMNQIFKELRFSMSGCTDSACAVKIGKMLSANRVLVGTVEKFGSKYIISGRLVDVEKGVAEFGHKEKVRKWDELDSCAERFALNILKKINIFKDKRYNQLVQIKTSLGDIKIKLFNSKAPVSVANFLQYVDSSFYNGTIFHRVISNFMIQAGGFTIGMQKKPTFKPIKNEASNGLSNTRGTIAMARTAMIDSATSQFFINVKDNLFLDHRDNSSRGFGYCVFGRVIDGMEVVDKIAESPTKASFSGENSVPLEPVIVESVEVIEG